MAAEQGLGAPAASGSSPDPPPPATAAAAAAGGAPASPAPSEHEGHDASGGPQQPASQAYRGELEQLTELAGERGFGASPAPSGRESPRASSSRQMHSPHSGAGRRHKMYTPCSMLTGLCFDPACLDEESPVSTRCTFSFTSESSAGSPAAGEEAEQPAGAGLERLAGGLADLGCDSDHNIDVYRQQSVARVLEWRLEEGLDAPTAGLVQKELDEHFAFQESCASSLAEQLAASQRRMRELECQLAESGWLHRSELEASQETIQELQSLKADLKKLQAKLSSRESEIEKLQREARHDCERHQRERDADRRYNAQLQEHNAQLHEYNAQLKEHNAQLKEHNAQQRSLLDNCFARIQEQQCSLAEARSAASGSTAAAAATAASGSTAAAAATAASGTSAAAGGTGSKPRLTCFGCGTTRRKIFKCKGCRAVYFCSTKCQRASWPVHKAACKEAQEQAAAAAEESGSE
ncbi:cre-set-18 [Chlorella sorokiniana]|uniref:Cre-set-18 n=1 Tax=Chlorella sorokiniana TaxID=3076 RepID=A0A2P6TH22_CHLSO|nr:cre-set-18 [Chlorella sorokiniana]|eukprot:PRW33583.1 cre-set-18 [Chlorella sorokiniana]